MRDKQISRGRGKTDRCDACPSCVCVRCVWMHEGIWRVGGLWWGRGASSLAALTSTGLDVGVTKRRSSQSCRVLCIFLTRVCSRVCVCAEKVFVKKAVDDFADKHQLKVRGKRAAELCAICVDMFCLSVCLSVCVCVCVSIPASIHPSGVHNDR